MSVSVVLCTYNGARYLSEQLDSLLSQTLLPDEILIQDDGSTDETEEIVRRYIDDTLRYDNDDDDDNRKRPRIRFVRNEGPHGVNANFFTALQRAEGDFLAICDQDDIWANDKLEKQMAAIGDNLLIGGQSLPFSDDVNAPVDADTRLPNIDLLRMMFVGMMPGHTQLLRRELLDLMPQCEWFMYDLQTQALAAAYERIAYLPQVVVHQRRHLDATTYVAPRSRQRSLTNALRTLKDTLGLYCAARPHIRYRFEQWTKFFDQLDVTTPSLERAREMAKLLSGRGVMNYLRLTAFCYRHRLRLFHTVERDTLLTKLRALYFPIFCATYYRYLVERNAH